jgi:hypothetical protein
MSRFSLNLYICPVEPFSGYISSTHGSPVMIEASASYSLAQQAGVEAPLLFIDHPFYDHTTFEFNSRL